jgi:TolA-binding protein
MMRGTGVRLSVFALLAPLAACATKGQVRLLEGELRSMRIETARRDSVRAAALAAIITLEQRIIDSVAAGREALRTLDVRLSNDLTDLQRQLLQVQELTGQSQQRLTQLKAQIDTRAEQAEAVGAVRPAGADTGARAAVTAPVVPTADQIYKGARDQHGRNALSTARMAYHELLKNYPTDPRAPDALFYIGETFAAEAPDSAVVYYAQVVARFRASPRASSALYRLGRLEEARRNPVAARAYYDRLIREYPATDDADLARERLKILRP